MVPKWHLLLGGVLLLLVNSAADTQLVRGMGGGVGTPLGGLSSGMLQGPLGTINRTAGGLSRDSANTVDTVSRDLVGRPLEARALSKDPLGAPIIKNRILAISPTAQSLAIAERLKFQILRQEVLKELGLTSVTLEIPDGMSEADALIALRLADPIGMYDFDHIYNPTGEAWEPPHANDLSYASADTVRIGMIDGGVGTNHPALRGQAIQSQVFAGEENAPATQHGTAIASLLIGKDGAFSGYISGAKLYVADVFGGAADGGSATDIARALNWLAENRIPVTNVSLAGPNNALLAAAVRAFVSGGHVLVAAAGNNGPAAPPNYPAAYEGVIGVTSVDAGRNLEIDANRNAVRFAALGVGVRAANLPRGYADVTGTSYAVPAVAARLALQIDRPAKGAVDACVDRLSRDASPIAGTGLLYVSAPPAAVISSR
jgi:hypothetical protein